MKENITTHFNEQSSRFDSIEFGSQMMHPILRKPYEYIEENLLSSIEDKEVLDYCCGTGIYSIYPALKGASLTGIDISDQSIKVAKKRAESFSIIEKCNFLVMDAERLELPDNHFDIVVSYGSLSYLDLKIVYKELHRVLKSDGMLIVVDSLAHNPIFRFNRRKNLNWAGRDAIKFNTLRRSDIIQSKKYFSDLSIKHFDLISVLFYYLDIKMGLKIHSKFFNFIDSMLLKIPFFQWLSFKVVYTCKKLDF